MTHPRPLRRRAQTAVCALLLVALTGPIAAPDARSWVVNQKHTQASDDNAGTEASPYLTINKAAQMANAGDTVLVHAGVYRERVSPARSGTSAAYITYTPVPGDTVYIKGSEAWTPDWQAIAVDVYAAKPDSALFGSYNPYHMRLAGGTGQTLGQIFVDGRFLQEVTSRAICIATASSWWHDSLTDTIVVHVPAGVSPSQALVELTVRSRVFAPHTRGIGYIRVTGFVMEHCANQNPSSFWSIAANAQSGLIGCRSGNHWIIENNVIRHGKTIGLDFGNEGGRDNEGSQPTPAGVGYHIIRANIIGDHGTCGICGQRGTQTQIVNNVIERNNHMRAEVVENSGFKAHNFSGGIFEGNVVRYNQSYGVWLDAGWPNARVSRNLVYGNSSCGMFFEIGSGPAVFDNNIVVYNRESGIFGRDAANVTVVHNLIHRNSQFGIYLQEPTGRTLSGDTAKLYNWKFYNNIIYRNGAMEIKCDPHPGVYNNSYADNVFLPGKMFRVDTTLTARDTLIDSLRVDTSAAMTVRIAARSSFFAMACTTFAGIARDYPGNAMPATNPLAGPFQGLSQGINDLSLAIEGIPGQVAPVRAGLPAAAPTRQCGVVRMRAIVTGVAGRTHGPEARRAPLYSMQGRRIDPNARTAPAGIVITPRAGN